MTVFANSDQSANFIKGIFLGGPMAARCQAMPKQSLKMVGIYNVVHVVVCVGLGVPKSASHPILFSLVKSRCSKFAIGHV